MITIKGRFATFGEIWFDEEPPPMPAVDVLTFRGRPAPLGHDEWSAFLSLVHDLTLDEAALLASFDSTSRYEVRRAQAHDGLTAEVIADARSALDAFCAFYDDFARQKELGTSYRRGLEAMCDAGRLVLTAASRGGERIVWHAYVTDGETAALLHSASHFRGAPGVKRALVGRANRWLHWRDMLAFKAMGVSTYDWGGLFEDESVPEQATINRFKRRFGGRPHRAYTCVALLTIKGRAYRAAWTVLERAGEWLAHVKRIFKIIRDCGLTVSTGAARRTS
jgi:hypothetical protein